MATSFKTTKQGQEGRNWVVLDAEGQIVGRLASKVASILRGKTKVEFAPHNDCGDFVVVINAEKIKFSGNKMEEKLYRDYTGYIGGLKEEVAGNLLARKPERLLQRAVQGMLPKTPLGRKQLGKLKIYTGSSHPHTAQVAGQAAK